MGSHSKRAKQRFAERGTRSSFQTYFISCMSMDPASREVFQAVKIGKTAELVQHRLSDLQSGNALLLSVVHIIDGDYEDYLHRIFSSDRVTRKDRSGRDQLTEWFRFSDDIKEFIELHKSGSANLFLPSLVIDPYLFDSSTKGFV